MIRELFQTKGEVSRKRYLFTGLVLFAVKYALDYLLTAVLFHRPWRWFPYLMAADMSYAFSMLALAMPFVWIGVAMTTRRICSAGLPRWLV